MRIPVVTSTLGLCASVGFLCSSPKWNSLLSAGFYWCSFLFFSRDDGSRLLSPLARCDVGGGARTLRAAVGAVASSLGVVAVARRVRGPCAGIAMPPHSQCR